MNKGRLEAFSDGVFAIIITIMVLELHAPIGSNFSSLKPLESVLLSYVLSFINVGLYWNNHHHLLQATRRISGAVLWANLHLLFWLSLIPVVTNWLGETHFGPLPAFVYGLILLMSAAAWMVLVVFLVRCEGPDSPLKKAVKRGAKEYLSIALYVFGVAIAMWHPCLACVLYGVPALLWIVPDRRIEKQIGMSATETE